jgi:hypothetical protein
MIMQSWICTPFISRAAARWETAVFAATREHIAEMAGLARAFGEERQRPPRPEIQINNRTLDDVVADAWRAVLAANKPPLLRAREWVRLDVVAGEPWLVSMSTETDGLPGVTGLGRAQLISDNYFCRMSG